MTISNASAPRHSSRFSNPPFRNSTPVSIPNADRANSPLRIFSRRGSNADHPPERKAADLVEYPAVIAAHIEYRHLSYFRGRTAPLQSLTQCILQELAASAQRLLVGQHGADRRPDGAMGVQCIDIGKARLCHRCSTIGRQRGFPSGPASTKRSSALHRRVRYPGPVCGSCHFSPPSPC